MEFTKEDFRSCYPKSVCCSDNTGAGSCFEILMGQNRLLNPTGDYKKKIGRIENCPQYALTTTSPRDAFVGLARKDWGAVTT